jgi:hypothetical protein
MFTGSLRMTCLMVQKEYVLSAVQGLKGFSEAETTSDRAGKHSKGGTQAADQQPHTAAGSMSDDPIIQHVSVDAPWAKLNLTDRSSSCLGRVLSRDGCHAHDVCSCSIACWLDTLERICPCHITVIDNEVHTPSTHANKCWSARARFSCLRTGDEGKRELLAGVRQANGPERQEEGAVHRPQRSRNCL